MSCFLFSKVFFIPCLLVKLVCIISETQLSVLTENPLPKGDHHTITKVSNTDTAVD